MLLCLSLFSLSLFILSFLSYSLEFTTFFDILSILVQTYRFFCTSSLLIFQWHIFLKTATSLMENGVIFKGWWLCSGDRTALTGWVYRPNSLQYDWSLTLYNIKYLYLIISLQSPVVCLMAIRRQNGLMYESFYNYIWFLDYWVSFNVQN
jgi:hypothetical protein